MRTIERTTQFKRDYKRELKGRYRAELDEILLPVIKPYLDFGIFSELKSLDYFKQVNILFGALVWPRGQDISPSKLYAELRSHS